MLLEIKLSKRTIIIAGFITIAYILIQVFQFYVFNSLGSTQSVSDELIQGSERLNLAFKNQTS